jgi:hypothetical protein
MRTVISDGWCDSRLAPPSDLIQMSIGGNRAIRAELWLRLKVYLEQRNPAGGAADGKVMDSSHHNLIHIVRWSEADWNRWKTRYKEVVGPFWDDRFYLLTPPGYHGLDTGGQQPLVECRFTLEIAATATTAHTTVTVVKVDANETFFRSAAYLISNLDLGPLVRNSRVDTTSWAQIVAQHEVGHLLGLYDVGHFLPACQANPNSTLCYGATGSFDERTIMGTGSAMDPRFAEPWQKRMGMHTETLPSDWMACMSGH